MKKVKVSITLDKDIYDKLKYYQTINKCNFSAIMCLILRRSTNDYGKFLFNQTNDIKFKE